MTTVSDRRFEIVTGDLNMRNVCSKFVPIDPKDDQNVLGVFSNG